MNHCQLLPKVHVVEAAKSALLSSFAKSAPAATFEGHPHQVARTNQNFKAQSLLVHVVQAAKSATISIYAKSRSTFAKSAPAANLPPGYAPHLIHHPSEVAQIATFNVFDSLWQRIEIRSTTTKNGLGVKVPFSVQKSNFGIFKTPLHKKIAELNLSHLPRLVDGPVGRCLDPPPWQSPTPPQPLFVLWGAPLVSLSLPLPPFTRNTSTSQEENMHHRYQKNRHT